MSESPLGNHPARAATGRRRKVGRLSPLERRPTHTLSFAARDSGPRSAFTPWRRRRPLRLEQDLPWRRPDWTGAHEGDHILGGWINHGGVALGARAMALAPLASASWLRDG